MSLLSGENDRHIGIFSSWFFPILIYNEMCDIYQLNGITREMDGRAIS